MLQEDKQDQEQLELACINNGRTLQQFADKQRRQFTQVQDALEARLAELDRAGR